MPETRCCDRIRRSKSCSPRFVLLGYEVTPSDVAAVRARMAPHLVDIAEVTGVQNPSLSAEASLTFWSFLYRRFLEELEVADEDLVKELFTVFSSSASYKLYADVLPAVEALRSSGYRMGLISNFETWLEDMLVDLELGSVFEPVVISGREGIENRTRLSIRSRSKGPASTQPGASTWVTLPRWM